MHRGLRQVEKHEGRETSSLAWLYMDKRSGLNGIYLDYAVVESIPGNTAAALRVSVVSRVAILVGGAVYLLVLSVDEG